MTDLSLIVRSTLKAANATARLARLTFALQGARSAADRANVMAEAEWAKGDGVVAMRLHHLADSKYAEADALRLKIERTKRSLARAHAALDANPLPGDAR